MYACTDLMRRSDQASIESQVKLLWRYAAENGFDVAREFTDEHSRRGYRESFAEMIKFLRAQGEIRNLVIKQPNCLFRKMKDWAEFDELMDKMGVQVHWAEVSKTPPSDFDSGAKKAQDISVTEIKRRSRNLLNEVRGEQMAKAERGIYPSVSPMGYLDSASDGQKAVVVDEARAPLIANLFEWAASGEHSIDSLSTKARDLGLSYRKSGKPVSNSTIYKILRNPFYAGRFMWNGRMYQGRHKPIISMKLWGEVQNVLDERENSVITGNVGVVNKF